MPVPGVHYARSGSLNIAYQAWGRGPVDIVLVPGFISHIEVAWEEPAYSRFLWSLSTFSRVIAFDKRGMGLSDREPGVEAPDLTRRVADIRTVMRAAHSTRAILFSWSEGGPSAIAFAAEHPESTAGLVLIGTTARFTEADDFPDGAPALVVELLIEALEEGWGSGVGLELYAPSVASDDHFRRWWARYQRLAATPGAVAASLRMQLDVDVRHLLAELQVPVLVLHRTGDMVVPVTWGRHSARIAPNAEYVEFPGPDHIYWLGDQGLVLRAIRRFVEGTPTGRGALETRHRRIRRPSEGWESLTEAELLVVGLVGQGLTNNEIAQRLHVSPRTVQTHVQHVFLKLRLSRRSEIAAEASRRL